MPGKIPEKDALAQSPVLHDGGREGDGAEPYPLPELSACRICPRQCGADRNGGQRGVCGMTAELRVARAALHFWEEPCISGTGGSGAVFFSGCALRCVYCQNHAISHGGKGQAIGIGQLSDIFLRLEGQGAENINLVTPDHFFPQIRLAMDKARREGLRIPFAVNCSGYETAAQLRMLEGLSDIYLMDFKYMDAEKAARYSGAADYPARAKESLAEMLRQQPVPVFDSDGMLRRGVIVRHLLLPGMVRNAKEVIGYVHERYGKRVLLSILRQYTPLSCLNPPQKPEDRARHSPAASEDHLAEQAEKGLSAFPELCRKVKKREYERLLDYALALGIENAYIQEGSSAVESFIPAWDGTGL